MPHNTTIILVTFAGIRFLSCSAEVTYNFLPSWKSLLPSWNYLPAQFASAYSIP